MKLRTKLSDLTVSELVSVYKTGNFEARFSVYSVLRRRGYSAKGVKSLLK